MGFYKKIKKKIFLKNKKNSYTRRSLETDTRRHTKNTKNKTP